MWKIIGIFYLMALVTGAITFILQGDMPVWGQLTIYPLFAGTIVNAIWATVEEVLR